MKIVYLLTLLFLSVSIQQITAQYKRIDTTMKIGNAGFKLVCNNKNDDKNYISITPIGFSSSARDVSFEVKGKVKKAEVDDLNNDLFPDLVLYVYAAGEAEKGTVVGISSEKNETFTGILFPDIVNDPKLRTGYQGHDQFKLMEGTLMRKFPIFTTDTVGAIPSGMYRQVQYTVVAGERGSLKFKVARSYESAKQ